MSARGGEGAFLGRTSELRELTASFNARARRPSILVSGDAGVGKSRLVREFVARARRRGALVIEGGCLEAAADPLPFAPFVEALGRLHEQLVSTELDPFPAAGTELAAIVPSVPSTAAAQPDRLRLFESVRELFDRTPDPTVLVLEDLQVADASSLELYSYLVRRLRHGRVFLVATYRSEAMEQLTLLSSVVTELTSSGRAGIVELAPLPDDEMARLVQGQRRALAPDLVEAIVRRAQGNPFFAQELVAATDRAEGSLPPTLRASLLTLVRERSRAARLLLEILATIGRAARPAFIAALWEGDRAELDAAIDEAVKWRLLAREPASGTFWFRHALLAEAVRAELGPRRAARLHGQVAEVLAARPEFRDSTEAGAAAELAGHWVAAERLPEALRATIAAARCGAHVPAWREAYGWYSKAIELWPLVAASQRPADADLSGLLHDAAAAACVVAGPDRAADLERRSIEAFSKPDHPAALGGRYATLARWYVEQWDISAMLAAAERAIELVPPHPPTAERAIALAALASARMQWCAYPEAVDAASQACSVAAAVQSLPLEAWARAILGLCLMELGHEDAALAQAGRAVELGDAAPDVWSTMAAHSDRIAVLRRRAADHKSIEAAFDAFRGAADRLDMRSYADGWLSLVELLLAFQAGDWAELEAGLRMRLADPVPLALDTVLVILGGLEIARGELEQGDRHVRQSLAAAVDPSPEDVSDARFNLALAAILRGRPGDALAIVAESLADLARTGAPLPIVRTAALGLRAAADLAETRQARGAEAVPTQSDLVAELQARIEACLAGTLVPGMALGFQLRASCDWGLAEMARLSSVPGCERWHAAAEELAASWRPDIAAYVRYREAEAIMQAHPSPGEAVRARAAAALRTARELAARLELRPLLHDIDSLARRGRIDLALPAAPVSPPHELRLDAPFALSRRELEVLGMLADGRTNREIGDALFITDKTASVHVTHILDKLGVNSRGAAAALAARLGLLDRDDEQV